MTGDPHDDELHEHGEPAEPGEPPWHHSTATVFGASVAALAAIALMVFGGLYLSRQFDKQPEAPTEFVNPTYSTTSTHSTLPSTTTTTTTSSFSPRPVETTDLNPPGMPSETSPGETTSDTDTTTTTTTTTTTSGSAQWYSTTTHHRPRTNVTRTLYPAPGN